MPPDDLPPVPRNLVVSLEYDGSAYCGWETQKNGVGIQEVLGRAVEQITGEKTTINGSGRTDAGVHAKMQVANFTLQNRIAVGELHRALNAVLPEDIAVTAAREAPLHFHARFSAVSKTYRYTILNSRIRSPLQRHQVYQIRARLDDENMRAAATRLVGKHDFSALCKESTQVSSCVREILALEVTRDGRIVRIDVTGTGFLYNMVRIIAGTLVYVGSGRIEAGAIDAILASRRRSSAGPTLPACGLTLLGVSYGDGFVLDGTS